MTEPGYSKIVFWEINFVGYYIKARMFKTKNL